MGYADLFQKIVTCVLLEEMITGTMVAPFFNLSNFFCFVNMSQIPGEVSGNTIYLSLPPPSSCIHVMGDTIVIGIMTLRCKNQIWCKFGFSI